MTHEQETLNEIRTVIDGLEPGQRQAVYRIAQQLRDVINAGGDFGRVALALVGAEEAAA